jgi:hypothetical protein
VLPWVVAVVAVAVLALLVLTEWGRDQGLPFLLGLSIILAVISAIPAIVGLVRAAGRPPGERRRRFWATFGVALGIEVAIVVISIGTCFVLFSQEGF